MLSGDGVRCVYYQSLGSALGGSDYTIVQMFYLRSEYELVTVEDQNDDSGVVFIPQEFHSGVS